MSERLTENERKLALAAFARDNDARRWGNLVLNVYDETAIENGRLAQKLDEAQDFALAVMDKNIGPLSGRARGLVGEINTLLGDLPTVEEVQGIFARAALGEEAKG